MNGRIRGGMARLALTLSGMAAVVGGCTAVTPAAAPPPVGTFCLEAQRFIVDTRIEPRLVVHEDFDAFVTAKALIEPLSIHQYVWRDDDGAPLMISCKLKSADHLDTAFGAGTAGATRPCQDLNRRTWRQLRARRGGDGPAVVFDENEDIYNPETPGMTGPDWLAPYVMTWRDDISY